MILVKKITMMILINVTVSNDGDSDDDGYDINTNNLHYILYILNRQSISDQTTALSFSSIHTFQNTNSSQSSSSCHTKHLIYHLPSIRLPRTTLTSPPNLYPQVVPRQSYSGWSMTKWGRPKNRARLLEWSTRPSLSQGSRGTTCTPCSSVVRLTSTTRLPSRLRSLWTWTVSENEGSSP